MFDKQYRFTGTHAMKVKRLTSPFDGESKAKIFKRNIDVYVNAPLVGFLYGRRSDKDEEKNPETGMLETMNVMGDMVINTEDELMFNYRLIMLLDKKHEPDIQKRIDKAFRYMGEDKEEEYFDSYVRGGVDVLYEKLIEEANEPNDYIANLFYFIEEFNDRFNSKIKKEEIFLLCN